MYPPSGRSVRGSSTSRTLLFRNFAWPWNVAAAPSWTYKAPPRLGYRRRIPRVQVISCRTAHVPSKNRTEVSVTCMIVIRSTSGYGPAGSLPVSEQHKISQEISIIRWKSGGPIRENPLWTNPRGGGHKRYGATFLSSPNATIHSAVPSSCRHRQVSDAGAVPRTTYSH